jgi:uncharacterized protein YbjT (DUF2867 family)
MRSILVTGGTGTLGRSVVRRLRAEGVDTRVVTRRKLENARGIRYFTADLLRMTDLGEAIDGVDTIIHCAGSNRGDEIATRNLMTAVERGGGAHIVYISVVGAERIPVRGPLDHVMFGYFEMKRRAEDVVAGCGLPWTTIRATQFHDLVLTVLEKLFKLPLVVVPADVAIQPVDADDVAKRLVELAFGPPSGLVSDLGGPRVYATVDLVRGYSRTTHRRRLVLPLRLRTSAGGALRAGALLASDDAPTGTKTWEQFLTARQHGPATADESPD